MDIENSAGRSNEDSVTASKLSQEAFRQLAWQELFGAQVSDSRPGNSLPSALFQTNDLANLASCDKFPRTKTQKDSLEASKQGDSVLNRMYELAVLTPSGKLLPKDFENTYGKQVAEKMQELEIQQVLRQGSQIRVDLKSPLHYGDSSGSIDVAKQVSFRSRPQGGEVSLDDLRGVKASSGLFTVNVNSIELQPREKGYLSATVKADWTVTNVCAHPDGKIYR